MAVGRPSGVVLEVDQLKDRALQIVRRSRDPARCLQLMRAKAEAFLESGGLVAVRKELSVESKCVSDPGPEILASLPKAAHVQESKPTPTEVTLFEDKVIIQEPTPVPLDTTLFEDVVVGKIKSESDTVMTSPVSEAVGMCNSLTMISRQFMVADSVAAKSVSDSSVVNPVSILLGKPQTQAFGQLGFVPAATYLLAAAARSPVTGGAALLQQAERDPAAKKTSLREPIRRTLWPLPRPELPTGQPPASFADELFAIDLPSRRTPDTPCSATRRDPLQFKMETGKAVWDATAARIFCECAAKQVGLGNRPTKFLSATGYKNLVADFNVQT
ncbi:hypothetical protein ACQ4PT_055036 [Festuca glaucescens]